jgi:hypothetical protein
MIGMEYDAVSMRLGAHAHLVNLMAHAVVGYFTRRRTAMAEVVHSPKIKPTKANDIDQRVD